MGFDGSFKGGRGPIKRAAFGPPFNFDAIRRRRYAVVI